MGELTIAKLRFTLTQVIVLSSSLLGHKLGDPPAPWFDAATNACGGILYIVTGALVVDFYTNALGPPSARDAGLAMGSFSLITGLYIYLCWLCFGQAGNLGINSNATLLNCNSHFQDLSY